MKVVAIWKDFMHQQEFVNNETTTIVTISDYLNILRVTLYLIAEIIALYYDPHLSIEYTREPWKKDTT